MRSVAINHFKSTQQEADSRIILHAQDLMNWCDRVIVYSPDTDVLVLMALTRRILATYGPILVLKKKKRYIEVAMIQLDETVRAALLAFHAITGCWLSMQSLVAIPPVS